MPKNKVDSSTQDPAPTNSSLTQNKSQPKSNFGCQKNNSSSQAQQNGSQISNKFVLSGLILMGLVVSIFFLSLFKVPSFLNLDSQEVPGDITPQNRPTGPEPDADQETGQVDSDGQQSDSFNQAVNQLNWDLYQSFVESQAQTTNIFYSPFSISTALTMTYEGARGDTAQEMQKALSLPVEKNELRQSYSQVMKAVNQSSDSYQLKTANALWAQEKYPFLESFIKINQDYYQAKLENLDFVGNPTQAVNTINDWVAEQTENKISDLLQQSDLTDMTRMVLTNAIYFLGDWQYQFNQDMTMPDVFYTPNGEKEVEMMSLNLDQAKLRYVQMEEWQVLELPYEGQDLSMVIFLPEFDQTKPGSSLTQHRTSLSWKKLIAWQNQLEPTKIKVYLPKFKLKTHYYLGSHLKRLGMKQAFGMQANFAGMTGNQDLFISKVIHQAMVEVDEKGTEAAASTAVVAEFKSAPGGAEGPPIFRADHPFFFVIKHQPTDTILFMGEVNDPTTS